MSPFFSSATEVPGLVASIQVSYSEVFEIELCPVTRNTDSFLWLFSVPLIKWSKLGNDGLLRLLQIIFRKNINHFETNESVLNPLVPGGYFINHQASHLKI